jgi:hypothetical protein
MQVNTLTRTVAASAIAVGLAWGAFPSTASATHSWGDFHWARTSNPFTIKLVRHLTSTWSPYLDLASAAWTTPSKLNTTIIVGANDSLTRQACPTENGRVAVCNYPYGVNGWIGLATIWFDGNHHITRATSKMNDSYGWTPGNRQLVMCQEVGHTLGLGHQDEIFGNANLGTCMDYTSLPFGPPNNLALNQHDHNQLNAIYTHLDGYTSLTASAGAMAEAQADSRAMNDKEEWGGLVASFNEGRTEIYTRGLGDGSGVVTYVVWAEEEVAKRGR